MFTLLDGVINQLIVLCVGVGFFLTAKATLQYGVTGIIYDVICVSHGRVFTAFHPRIICYYLYAQMLVVVYVVIHTTLVQGLAWFPLGYYGV